MASAVSQPKPSQSQSPLGGGTHFTSLRDYLHALADLGDLREVKREVDTNLEIGAIIRRTYEIYAPAPLFTNIRGYSGYRVLGAPLSYSSLPQARMARVALALGLPAETKPLDIVEALARAMAAAPIPPVVVERGECQENVLTGDKASLEIFPTPLIHAGDGGRYFNTLGCWVLRSPDGKWTNWSIARGMVLDGKRLSGPIAPYQHNGMIFKQWKERGEPMPFALVQGAEPAAIYAGGMPLPDGVDEAGFLGALFGEPLKLVKCKTVDLQVPASAEIVIEGHVSLDETALEGPMGEYHGYLQTEKFNLPVYHVTAITHRNNPILPVCSAGKPVEEDHTITPVAGAAVSLRLLREAGLPITSAWGVPEAAEHLLAFSVPDDWSRRTKLSANDLCRRIAEIVKATHGTQRVTRVLVCNDDIDLSDLRDLVWAWQSRCHPANGRFVLEDQPANPVEPMYEFKVVTGGDVSASKLNVAGPVEVLNCLLPLHGNLQCSDFAHNVPKEIQTRVLEHWDE
ncbi:MAG TPA: UbiD family decarboxylase [Terracidiphilus sp.]|nr:UbiD family decarboxylase [Terracidiphilus sp.]